MSLWLIRAGGRGEREEFALENAQAVIGWGELPDLSALDDRVGLMALLETHYPGEKHKRLLNWASQLWPFVSSIEVGDLVVLPLKHRSAVAIGQVAGGYTYRPENPADARHTRPVKWLKEVPRSAFIVAHRNSMGAFMTVCRLQKHGIEAAVNAMVTGTPPPASLSSNETEALEEQFNIQETADRQIRDYVAQRFKNHDLERLVEEVLRAQGHVVIRTGKGADGGVDLVAGHGPMGFDAPRMIVQVKSEDAAIDVKVVRELKGLLKEFSADYGLIVAWGGFKGSVEKESMRHFFEVRLWTGDDLIRELQLVYEELSETVQAEVPLKRIWTLALEED